MSAAAKEFVTRAIQENAAVIFSKSYCPYCVRAKKLLTGLGKPFTAYELDKRADGSQIQDYLEELTNQDTVPNIFIKQNHVGGCDDIHALHKQGKLLPLFD